MVEAEVLSDRVAIIDHGKIAALDTPQNLKKLIAKSDVSIFGAEITNLTPKLIEKINSLDVVDAVSQQDVHKLKISAMVQILLTRSLILSVTKVATLHQ